MKPEIRTSGPVESGPAYQPAAAASNRTAGRRGLGDAENRDRGSLYREIAKANDFSDGRIPDIQRIVAETRWRCRGTAAAPLTYFVTPPSHRA